jgi:hypothetical protein
VALSAPSGRTIPLAIAPAPAASSDLRVISRALITANYTPAA